MKFLLAGALVVASAAFLIQTPRAQTETAQTETAKPARRPGPYQMSYVLLPDDNAAHANKRAEVTKAMDAALALYNAMGEFDKKITASYNPGTPTADGNYNGNIRFGGQIGKRTALHELGHVLGVGTHWKWNELLKDGKWTGPHALAQLRAFDGPEAVLYGDRQHFWPYGLNFEHESSPENDRRHVLMVAAFRRDLGIVNGE